MKLYRRVNPVTEVVIWIDEASTAVATFYPDKDYQNRGLDAEIAWIKHLRGVDDVTLDDKSIDDYTSGSVDGLFKGEDRDELAWFFATRLIDGAGYGTRELAEREYYGVTATRDTATSEIVAELIEMFDNNEQLAHSTFKRFLEVKNARN